MQLKPQTTFNKTRLSALLFTAALVGFWAIIFYFSPMTEDDNYFWSLRILGFRETLDFALGYGNGRLLGNMGIFYLVEHKALRVAVKALVMSAVCLLLPRLCGKGSKALYPAAFLLICLISPQLFSQVYTWTSGFQNYVPPVLLQLAVLWLLFALSEKHSLAPVLPAFVIGIAMQLYVEHSSIISILMALCLVLYALKARRSLLPGALAWLMGAAAGMALMLLIPKMAGSVMVDMSTHKGTVLSYGLVGAVVAMAKNGLVLLAQYGENVLLLLDMTPPERFEKLLPSLCALSLAAALWLAVHFADIDRMTNIRENYIRDAVAAGYTEIDYFMVPSDYVFNYWDQTIYSLYYTSLYKTEIQLNAIPAQSWFNEYYYN